MFGKKKQFGFLSKLLKETPRSAKEEEEGVVTTSTSLEIPVIRADDHGAAIDDLQESAAVSGGSTSPDSARSSSGGLEELKKVSPSPPASVDRLSVAFSSPDPLDNNTMADQTTDAKVRFSKDHLSTLSADDDDMDYSESLDALMRRRESGRRRSVRRSPKRGSSPFESDTESGGKSRRRSSTLTSTSCEDTQISIDEHEMTEEQMFESIRLHKELIESVKKQPWNMNKRLKVIRQAKAYVKKHQGELEQRLAHSKNTKDIMARYSIIFQRYSERIKREAVNLAKNLIPWEMRIKRIESHFGSVVASYFTFIRWLFWINIVTTTFISCLVIVPEVLAADRKSSGDRKELMKEEASTAFNLQQLWDFEGYLKNSPFFYGYYNNQEKTRQGFRIPLSYFMTLLGMYGYSFATILRRMAENTRLSKLSDKDEDCTFTWKLYTGWDYMIGNSETADNKVASILMTFKEDILEEREKKKEERNWKIVVLRILANFMVIILLGSSAYAVILVVRRSQEPEADSGWWRQNEVTVIVSLIGVIYPNLFDIIGTIEHNHPRTQLRYQLARIMILYLLNLYTLIFSLFSKVDLMILKLQDLRPNQTVASSFVTLSPAKQLFVSSSTEFELESDGMFSVTEATQMTMPTEDHFNYLRHILNITAGYHLCLINATCLALRVYCRTGKPVRFNATLSPDTSYYFSRLFPSEYNFSECYSFSNTSFSLQVTPLFENYNFTTMPTSFIRDNTEILEVIDLSLPLSNNMLDNETVTSPSNMDGKNMTFKAHDSSVYTYPTSNYWSSSVTSRKQLLKDLTVTTESTEKKRKRGRKQQRGHNTLQFTTTTQATTRPLGRNTVMPRYYLWNRLNKSHRDYGDNTSPTAPTTLLYDDVTEDWTVQTREDSTFVTPLLWNDTNSTGAPLSSTTNLKYITNNFIKTPDGCCYVIVECFLPQTFAPTYQPDNETDENVTDVYSPASSVVVGCETRRKLRKLCWETMFGQELVKLTVMDLVMTVANIVVTDYLRALFVRVMNHCWFWDLEKQFPGYGDFKIAENILHLVNNQGMVWMGMFFSPGITGVNMVKLVIILYVRSWAVLTSNIPHETVFKASGSNNFYYALLLSMLFLCTLPVGYAVVWLEPSWHCGPFSQYKKMYHIFTSSLQSVLPNIAIRALDYIASPGIVIPLLVLLVLVIYYLNSVAGSLREANKDLKMQLKRERTEERRRVFQMADAAKQPPNIASKWAVMKKVLTSYKNTEKEVVSRNQNKNDDTNKAKGKLNSSAFAAVIGDVLKANSLKSMQSNQTPLAVHKPGQKESKECEKPTTKMTKDHKSDASPCQVNKTKTNGNEER